MMAIKLVWDSPEKSILRYDIDGQWTWDDARQAVDRIFTMMDESPAEVVYTIPHFKGNVSIPPNGWKHFDILTSRSHPKAGLTVIVGTNWLLKSVIGTVKNAYVLTGREVDFEYARTLDDARAKIRRVMGSV